MSASLVGSEMCIRDSNKTGFKCVVGVLEKENRTAYMRNEAICNTQMLAPVSYTHLTLPTICSV
eukprot:4443214-Alexandrium_andersonii.AAC.1